MENHFRIKPVRKRFVILIVILLFILPKIGSTHFDYNFLNIMLYVSAIILALTIIINIVLKKKHFNAKKYFTEIFDKNKIFIEDYPKYRKYLFYIALLSRLYLVTLFIVVIIFNTALIAILTKIFSANPFFVLSIGTFVSVYEFVVAYNCYETVEIIYQEGETLKKYEFPEINKLAQEAALKVGILKEYKIKVLPGSAISIIEEKEFLLIFVGLDSLKILNSKELLAVFIHEFAHAKKDTRVSRKTALKCYKWQYLANRPPFFPSILFYGFSALINKQLSFFRIISSYKCEVEADKNILNEERQYAVNALAKLEISRLCNFCPLEENYYSEEAVKSFTEKNRNLLIRSYEKNKEIWRKMIVRQIQPALSSHPPLNIRMQNLNISSFDINFYGAEEKYDLDVKKIVDGYDRHFNLFTNWDVLRNKFYLRYKEAIKDYETSGTSRDLYAVALAYYYLCEKNKAEELFNIVAEEKKNKAAFYYLGILKCARYDDSGIEDLFKASDNAHYTDRALLSISHYLQYQGDLKLIEKYRDEFNRRTEEFLNISNLRFKKINKNEIPYEELNKLSEFLFKFDNIDGALILRKKTKNHALNILFYNFLDNDHTETETDHAALESFIFKECPNIILGGNLQTGDFLKLSYKFKKRVKQELLIDSINDFEGQLPRNPNRGEIKEGEKIIWKEVLDKNNYRIMILLIAFTISGFLVGGLISVISQSLLNGFYGTTVIFFGILVAAWEKNEKPRWLIVTEKKICYSNNYYYWFSYSEISKARIVRKPIDFLLGTKSLIITFHYSWKNSKEVIRRQAHKRHFFHLHDAEGIVSVIRQAMLKQKKLGPIIEDESIEDEPKKILNIFKD